MIYLSDAVRTRYAVAASEHPDVIRAQVELGQLEDQLRTLKDMRTPAVARVNAALNRPVSTDLPQPVEPSNEAVDVSEEQVLAWLRESNPELAALRHEIAREDQSVALAHKEYYPDVMVGVGFMEMGEDDQAGMMQGQKDQVMLMTSVNLPIWRSKLEAGVRGAEATRAAAAAMYADRENALCNEAKLTSFRLRDAQRKMNLYRDTLIPMARQSLKASQTAFETGKASFLDILDAERALLEFQLSYERARADRAEQIARLEMLAGRALPRAAKSAPGESKPKAE